MVTLPQYLLWAGCAIAEVLALYIAIECGQLRRFWDLYVYFGLCCITSVSRYVILRQSGLRSLEYAYFYYYSDAMLTIVLSLVAVRLFGHVYKLKTWKGIPLRVAIPGMLGVAIFSYSVVESHDSRLLTRFVVELSQNLYFSIVLLLAAAWVGTFVKKLRANAEVKLLWVFLIYSVILVSVYCARNLHPQSSVDTSVMAELAGVWLTVGSVLAVSFD